MKLCSVMSGMVKIWLGALRSALSLFLLGIITIVAIIVVLSYINYDKDYNIGGHGAKQEVGVVELTGEIHDSTEFIKLLTKASHNDRYKGLVVRVDSPGGAVGASEEIHRAIKEADKLKPVICSLGNLAASGALYAAVACRKIFANKGTLSGSIGVIMMMPNYQEIMDKVGLRMNIIKSGVLKDAGSPYRATTEADKKFLQSIVDTAYQQFVEIVASSRGLDIAKVREFADGRIIVGEDAKKLGIVDDFGGVREAAILSYSIAGGEGEPDVTTIKPKEGLKDIISQFGFAALFAKAKSYTSPQLLYMMEF